VVEVTDESFAADVLGSDRPVFVDFWAPWCGPCKGVEKVLGELETDHGERIHFVKVNIDEHPARAAELGVLSIPTVILFEGGERREAVVGVRPRAYFEEKFGPWLAA
jgi:thioredoxin 1